MIKKYFLLLPLIVMACTSEQHSAGTEMIVCGWDHVFIVDLNQVKTDGPLPPVKWSWRAKDQADLPDDFKNLFNTTDECKPFDHGNKILITASTGGIVLLDRKKDQVLFYARAANAHSADLLPNNRVAVAASHSNDGTGDRLILFDLDKPDEEILSEPLPWGHGVVWDEHRQLLWALSGHDIRAFQLKNWDTSMPELVKISTIVLPDSNGHDLYPVSNSSHLIVTTHSHCWFFDRDTHEFMLLPVLAHAEKVKSFSQHPQTGQYVYVQAEGENWWAERIHFIDPKLTLYQPGEHFYKVRWNIRVQ